MENLFFTESRSATNEVDFTKAFIDANPDVFPTRPTARRYFSLVQFPVSRRWRYQLNGKTGNTLTLHLLFRIEFGSDFTTAYKEHSNQHPEFAIFQLRQSGLLACASELRSEGPNAFLQFPGVSIATVRNPFTRTVSSFLYFCNSHRVGDARLLKERIRFNVVTGFNWGKDIDTVRGYEMFLEYVHYMRENYAPHELDAHWLPQTEHIQPEIYRPDVIGRVEDMPKFVADVCEALEVSEKIDTRRFKRNKMKVRKVPDFYQSPKAVELVRTIYAKDFETFGYDDTVPARKGWAG
ncbi:sulfotransferase family 2 domain-containing protein [Acuticoccus mangrovi]|uniref:Sulfotransferase family 2 domain-containing protein n=1 Tax=Acuticoccus mangrovi TaxID=2796142 RepID=A0A934INX8_9HYPH|nr:sulfotransferase family 2 domain-containing protein [Acuticoccus mangrovi]MBJ3776060.1 sulfotransferase family 2 domain-containing protein [Acuticoccus mangrovi]